MSLRISKFTLSSPSEKSGNMGNEIIIYVRAVSASSAKADALIQVRAHFGSGGGDVTVISCKESL